MLHGYLAKEEWDFSGDEKSTGEVWGEFIPIRGWVNGWTDGWMDE